MIAWGNGVIVSSLDETLGRMRRAFRQVLSVISDCTKRQWRPSTTAPRLMPAMDTDFLFCLISDTVDSIELDVFIPQYTAALRTWESQNTSYAL